MTFYLFLHLVPRSTSNCHYFLDSDYVPWEETDNITAESLKNICDQVLPFLITPSDSVSNYNYEPPGPDFRIERMVKYSLLPLENHKDDTGHVPVIKCFYKEKKFYLTHADDNLVFELHCEDADQDIYTLKSGMYRVKYP